VRASTDDEIRAEAQLTLNEDTQWLEPWRLARLDQLAAACDDNEGIDMYRMALALSDSSSTTDEAQVAADMAYVAALVICRDHSLV
jgi:hypothetical protein